MPHARCISHFFTGCTERLRNRCCSEHEFLAIPFDRARLYEGAEPPTKRNWCNFGLTEGHMWQVKCYQVREALSIVFFPTKEMAAQATELVATLREISCALPNFLSVLRTQPTLADPNRHSVVLQLHKGCHSYTPLLAGCLSSKSCRKQAARSFAIREARKVAALTQHAAAISAVLPDAQFTVLPQAAQALPDNVLQPPSPQPQVAPSQLPASQVRLGAPTALNAVTPDQQRHFETLVAGNAQAFLVQKARAAVLAVREGAVAPVANGPVGGQPLVDQSPAPLAPVSKQEMVQLTPDTDVGQLPLVQPESGKRAPVPLAGDSEGGAAKRRKGDYRPEQDTLPQAPGSSTITLSPTTTTITTTTTTTATVAPVPVPVMSTPAAAGLSSLQGVSGNTVDQGQWNSLENMAPAARQLQQLNLLTGSLTGQSSTPDLRQLLQSMATPQAKRRVQLLQLQQLERMRQLQQLASPDASLPLSAQLEQLRQLQISARDSTLSSPSALERLWLLQQMNLQEPPRPAASQEQLQQLLQAQQVQVGSLMDHQRSTFAAAGGLDSPRSPIDRLPSLPTIRTEPTVQAVSSTSPTSHTPGLQEMLTGRLGQGTPDTLSNEATRLLQNGHLALLQQQAWQQLAAAQQQQHSSTPSSLKQAQQHAAPYQTALPQYPPQFPSSSTYPPQQQHAVYPQATYSQYAAFQYQMRQQQLMMLIQNEWLQAQTRPSPSPPSSSNVARSPLGPIQQKEQDSLQALRILSATPARSAAETESGLFERQQQEQRARLLDAEPVWKMPQRENSAQDNLTVPVSSESPERPSDPCSPGLDLRTLPPKATVDEDDDDDPDRENENKAKDRDKTAQEQPTSCLPMPFFSGPSPYPPSDGAGGRGLPGGAYPRYPFYRGTNSIYPSAQIAGQPYIQYPAGYPPLSWYQRNLSNGDRPNSSPGENPRSPANSSQHRASRANGAEPGPLQVMSDELMPWGDDLGEQAGQQPGMEVDLGTGSIIGNNDPVGGIGIDQPQERWAQPFQGTWDGHDAETEALDTLLCGRMDTEQLVTPKGSGRYSSRQAPRASHRMVGGGRVQHQQFFARDEEWRDHTMARHRVHAGTGGGLQVTDQVFAGGNAARGNTTLFSGKSFPSDNLLRQEHFEDMRSNVQRSRILSPMPPRSQPKIHPLALVDNNRRRARGHVHAGVAPSSSLSSHQPWTYARQIMGALAMFLCLAVGGTMFSGLMIRPVDHTTQERSLALVLTLVLAAVFRTLLFAVPLHKALPMGNYKVPFGIMWILTCILRAIATSYIGVFSSPVLSTQNVQILIVASCFLIDVVPLLLLACTHTTHVGSVFLLSVLVAMRFVDTGHHIGTLAWHTAGQKLPFIHIIAIVSFLALFIVLLWHVCVRVRARGRGGDAPKKLGHAAMYGFLMPLMIEFCVLLVTAVTSSHTLILLLFLWSEVFRYLMKPLFALAVSPGAASALTTVSFWPGEIFQILTLFRVPYDLRRVLSLIFVLTVIHLGRLLASGLTRCARECIGRTRRREAPSTTVRDRGSLSNSTHSLSSQADRTTLPSLNQQLVNVRYFVNLSSLALQLLLWLLFTLEQSFWPNKCALSCGLDTTHLHLVFAILVCSQFLSAVLVEVGVGLCSYDIERVSPLVAPTASRIQPSPYLTSISNLRISISSLLGRSASTRGVSLSAQESEREEEEGSKVTRSTPDERASVYIHSVEDVELESVEEEGESEEAARVGESGTGGAGGRRVLLATRPRRSLVVSPRGSTNKTNDNVNDNLNVGALAALQDWGFESLAEEVAVVCFGLYVLFYVWLHQATHITHI